MEIHEFGARLRELRKRSGMSQRELAQKVKIDFTYLSKIESGRLSPPSEKVITKLAEVLGANKDELIVLAGKVPSDLAKILTNKEILVFLRSNNSSEIIRSINKQKKS